MARLPFPVVPRGHADTLSCWRLDGCCYERQQRSAGLTIAPDAGRWRAKVLSAPGAEQRVASIEAEIRRAAGLTMSREVANDATQTSGDVDIN